MKSQLIQLQYTSTPAAAVCVMEHGKSEGASAYAEKQPVVHLQCRAAPHTVGIRNT